MKTIEDCEVEIEQKSILIQDQMKIFADNINNIGVVVGKDPSVVYDTIKAKYNTTIETYNTLTRRNVEILNGYVIILDKILAVLGEVMFSIRSINESKPEDQITIKASAETMLESAASKIEELSTSAEQAIETYSGKQVDSSMFKMALTGTAAFVLLRMVGAGRLISIGGAVVAAYWIGKK